MLPNPVLYLLLRICGLDWNIGESFGEMLTGDSVGSDKLGEVPDNLGIERDRVHKFIPVPDNLTRKFHLANATTYNARCVSKVLILKVFSSIGAL
jgi:hypothetical protein